MGERELEALLAQRAIERVAPDPETAREELAAARRHLVSAELIAGDDPAGAYAMAYDAARKAISAHMRARGYRLVKGKGHHARTGSYARVALEAPDVDDHVDAFDDARQLRNQAEYDALMVEREDVEELLAHATALADAVEHQLGF